ncbi:Phage minor tail protein [Lelliottia jeotgali]|nr:Phage minor tail protein [Lelliottia jeotgali]
MSAGTLTLTNNSAAVTGAGTTFTTDLAAGDFIVVTVGGVPYTLPIKTVNSNTSLVLVSNYTGPTQSGAAWSAVPRVALNMVTAALVAQSAEALRGMNYDKQNWQSIFSGTGTVTVKLPDGSTWSGPAWNGIATTITGKLDKIQNLSDLSDKDAARKNLSLGTSAIKDIGTSGDFIPLMSGANTWSGAQTCTNNFLLRFNFPVMQMMSTGADGAVVGKTVLFGNEIDGSRTFYIRRFGDGSSATNQAVIYFPTTSGSIALMGTSDRNYKHDIKPYDGIQSLQNIESMDLVTFVFNDDEQERTRRGVIAQQIETIDPAYVKHTSEPFDDEGNTRERIVLDSNPLLLDALCAIQVLSKRLSVLEGQARGKSGESDKNTSEPDEGNHTDTQ